MFLNGIYFADISNFYKYLMKLYISLFECQKAETMFSDFFVLMFWTGGVIVHLLCGTRFLSLVGAEKKAFPADDRRTIIMS